MNDRRLRIIVGLSLGLVASGCTAGGVVVTTGAAVGLGAAQERGLKGTANDTLISASIREKWFATNFDMFRALEVTTVDGRALLTGNVNDPEMRVEAVRLAWQVDAVKEIINEIHITDQSRFIDGARDIWISTQLRALITFDPTIQSINYSIDTVNGTVYLMGIAQDQSELDRVTHHARNLAYVRRVVSYAVLRSARAKG
jgi:osmotically-inducible protein OsmY